MSAAIDLVVTEFVFLAIGCYFLLRYYAASMVSYDVFAAVYISWVLGFASVLFLPYDLSLAIVENEQSIALERVWKFVYWSTFFLAWIILPIQMEYHGSGHFSFKEKMWDSVYRLLFAGLIAIVAAIIYIIYLVSSSGGTLSQVVGFVMAMGNTYGVLLITLLMGNGLVALPMHLWRLGDVERGLRELYLSAAYVEESFQDARYEMEDCEIEVQKIKDLLDKSGSAALRNEIGPFVSILIEKISNFQFGPRSKSRAFVRGFQLEQIPDEVLVSKGHLIKLHARLMTAQIKARASERRWNVLISECERQEMISTVRAEHSSLSQSGWCAVSTDAETVNTESTAPFILFSPWTWSLPQFCQPYCTSLYLIWSQRLYTHSCRAAAIVCAMMSILILWSEMLMSSQVHSPVGILMTAYDYQQSSSVMVQAVSFVALMYMSMCTYWPLFRLNIGWAYQLQGPQQSSPFSLIFNAEYLSRLQFTIGYNFLMYLNVPKTGNTAFNQLMKNIELIPVFGTSFAVYIPLIMLVVALLTLFDGYRRIVQVLGIEWEDSTSLNSEACSFSMKDRNAEAALDPQLQEKVRTGKLIVTNEVKQRRMADQLNMNRPGHSAASSSSSTSIATSSSSSRLDSKSGPLKMRIGMSDPSQITAITEALIPNIPRYRNVETAVPDHDFDGEDENNNIHADPYARNYRNNNSDSQRNALFNPFRGGSSSSNGSGSNIYHNAHSSNRSSSGVYANVAQDSRTTSSVANPMNTTSRSHPQPHRDLFSIDNEDEDGDNSFYGSRYANV